MLPVDISEHGYLVDRVIKISLWGGVVIGIVSFLIVFYILWRFSRSRNPNPLADIPPALKKVVYIDIAMIIFDVILLVTSTYAWVFFFVRRAEAVKQEVIERGEKYVEARVIGRQWFWTFEYPGKDGKFGTNDDFRLANVLVVPQGHWVFLKMTAGDVIHSFFVPFVRLKYDTIPGRWTHIWFKPLEEGVYEIACAELCGALHFRMKGYLVVMSEEEWRRWLEGAPYTWRLVKRKIDEARERNEVVLLTDEIFVR